MKCESLGTVKIVLSVTKLRDSALINSLCFLREGGATSCEMEPVSKFVFR